MTSTPFFQRTAIDPAALFDELVKIGAAAKKNGEPPKRHWAVDVGTGILGASAGMAAGYGLSELLVKAFPNVYNPAKITPGKAMAAKITLPILGVAGAILANKYRQKLDERYSRAPGWKNKKP